MNLTLEAVQRYVRIGLQWLAAYLVTAGFIDANASWVQPVIGFIVGAVSLVWTLYGNRLAAKLNEVAKSDEVKKIVVKDTEIADPAVTPSPKVTT